MSKMSLRARELKSINDHDHFLRRIKKTLYYGLLPSTDRLSLPITELASELFSEMQNRKSLDRLYCKDAAYISREACVTPCSFVLGMLYLERLKACNPEYLQQVAPSHLFLVSLMVSTKFLYDIGEDYGVIMQEWAVSGGITIEELIDLEKQFLNAIQWDIFVNESTFWQKFYALETTLAKRMGKMRGYYTYTELSLLMTTFDLHVLINAVTSIMAVLVTTYTAGLLTIMGSMFIASHIPGHSLNQLPVQFKYSLQNMEYNDTFTFDTNIQLTDNRKNEYSLSSLDMFETSFSLSSLWETASQNNCLEDINKSENQRITWDWWNNPTLILLSHMSQMTEIIKFIPNMKHTDTESIINLKQFELEDNVCKEANIMESTGHTIWTDSIRNFLSTNHIISFFQDIKS